MLADVLRYLRCPVCGQPLAGAGDTVLRCPGGHSFDVAKQGYVQLTSGPVGHAGDTAEMVEARVGFLARGHFTFMSTALVDAAPPGAGLVVDAGAGTGWHLAAVLDARPDAVGLALDVSKPALRRAARSHPRAGAVLCDVWHSLPVADGQADLLLNVFAPRNGAEYARVLRPDGTLLVVTPTAAHLGELVDRLGLLRVDPTKEDRVAGTLSPWFERYADDVLERRLELTGTEVATLVAMGPSAWHTDPGGLTGLPERTTVTASVRLSQYRLR